MAIAKRRLGKGLADIKPKAPPPMLPDDRPRFGDFTGAAAEMIEDERRHAMGGNKPPESTPLDKLLERNKELIATASAWLNNYSVDKGKPIDTPENAARLKGFKSQAAELAKEADEQRKKDQAPHAEAVKTIADFYRPIGTSTELILDRIRPLLTDWLKREQAEIDARARMAREEAERQRRAAEELAGAAERQMEEDLAGSQTNTMQTIIDAEEQQRAADKATKWAEHAAKQRAKVGAEFHAGSGVKRSAHLQTVYTYTVRDPMKAAQAFCDMHPDGRPKELIAALEKIAEYLHKQDRSRSFPGIVITEDQEARG